MWTEASAGALEVSSPEPRDANATPGLTSPPTAGMTWMKSSDSTSGVGVGSPPCSARPALPLVTVQDQPHDTHPKARGLQETRAHAVPATSSPFIYTRDSPWDPTRVHKASSELTLLKSAK